MGPAEEGVVHQLSLAIHWLTTSAHWHGTGGIPHRMFEHILMSGAATLIAIAIALPLGVLLGHWGRGGFLAINVTNIGRALPTFGVLVFLAVWIGLRGWPGFGARPTLIALILLGIAPVVTNSWVGMRGVDPEAKEAARGMGMTGRQLLFRVELPLAAPLIMAGIRTTAVQIVATATLAAYTSWGGLGRYIIDGFALQDDAQILAGALLVAFLSILTEVGLGMVQRRVTPGARRPAVGAVVAPEAAGMAPAA
jgi:osmoprotectant transport system permease protein